MIGFMKKTLIRENDIEEYINSWKKNNAHEQNGRYASFDYCFNYFQDFRVNGNIKDIVSLQKLQLSCLHLGFYLASWGMYRGSSSILQHSCHFLEKPLKVIAERDEKFWKIDVDEYTEDNIKLLVKCGEEIREKLKNTYGEISDTLVTKIMLGVFGNVPAYDTYFLKTMREKIGGTFNRESLEKIGKFYKLNKGVIKKLCKQTKTIDFLNSSKTDRHYTKAKIIDMYGFQKGYELDKKNENKH